MTRKEYRNHVHTMVDLVLDIQENVSSGFYPRAEIDLYRHESSVEVWIEKDRGTLKSYELGYPMRHWDTQPEDIIKKLQEVKTTLVENKEKFRQRPNQNGTQINIYNSNCNTELEKKHERNDVSV